LGKITLVVMTILKLLGVITVAWFAGPFTVGAVSTGLWMLVGGLIMLGTSIVVAAVGNALI